MEWHLLGFQYKFAQNLSDMFKMFVLRQSETHCGECSEFCQVYLHSNNCTCCHQTVTAFCRGYLFPLNPPVGEFSIMLSIIFAADSESLSPSSLLLMYTCSIQKTVFSSVTIMWLFVYITWPLNKKKVFPFPLPFGNLPKPYRTLIVIEYCIHRNEL